ncbi:MAG: TolC family protein [Paraprevotella sp.]|nr:TolC family protein [Paraprevotella sp.]
MKKIIMTMTTAALLSSCGLYKSYERPADIQTDGLYRSENSQNGDSLGIASLAWKEIFTDPQLQTLIEKGLAQNTDLRSAQLQIEQAEASLKAAKWAYIPSLAFSPEGTLSGVDWGKASKTYSIPVTASWQIDIFGSLHNAKKRAQVQVENSQAYRQAVESQLIATIANYYYSLAMMKDQLRVSMETEQSWKANVETTRALMNAGQSNMAAVSQTEANYYSICTQITDLKQQISDLEDEFSALLGEAPQKYDIGSMDYWKVPEQVSTGIPAAVLAHRPDVKQAETQLAAAYYTTNEARAAFYPNLNLSGTIGWTNSLGSVIVNPGKWIWSAVASLTQPLFQNGKLRAQYKISKSQQEQAKLTFQQTLLNAGKEVNTALTKMQASDEKETLYEKQIVSLETAVKSTQALMMNSSTNYLQVLTAQQSLLTAQMSQISNKFDKIQAVIELYQALGGGYTE